MKINNYFIILFGSVALLHLYSTFLSNTDIHFVTKPLLIPLLGLGLLLGEINYPKSIIGALLFSWIGDILLLFDDYFIPGLISFLTAHIFYILAFVKLSNKESNKVSFIFITTLFVIAYLTTFLTLIKSSLGDMMIPVFVYGLVISVMLWVALNRKNKTSSKSFSLTTIGACLFVLSDSLIAWNMFHSIILYADFLIMLTYLSAQVMIVSGLISSPKSS